MDIDKRWKINNICNCCEREQPDNENWGEEHATMGGSGFNFVFCPDCQQFNQARCDEIMIECLQDWQKRCREYWDNHERIS